MSRRRALLMRRGSKVTLTRTSNTTYLVEAVGGGIKANLKFKRLSDGYTQGVNNATLPYTFTHTAGEVWEVSGGNGYVSAWGIDIPAGGYLEAQNSTDLDLNDYMAINFYWDKSTPDSGELLFGKHIILGQDRWCVIFNGLKIGFYRQFSGTQYDYRNMDITTKGWYEFIVDINGSDLRQELNGVSSNNTIVNPGLGTSNPLFFRIGQVNGTANRRFVGKVQNYKHGTEVFSMQEGTGTTTTGSEGTVLNLEGGATWVKI